MMTLYDTAGDSVARSLDDLIRTRASVYRRQLVNMAINAVKIDGLPDDTPASFVMLGMITQGCAGVITDAPEAVRGWYLASPVEFAAPHSDAPTRAAFSYFNGRIVAELPLKPYTDKTPCGAVIRANPSMFPIIRDIAKTADECARIDAAILVNISTSSTAPIVVAEKETAEQIKTALKRRNLFEPYTVVSESIGAALSKSINMAAPFIADKLNDLHGQRWSEQLRRLGVVGQSDYKRERVQTAEVNAGVSEVIDWVYTLIDTANSDARRAGVPVTFSFNGAAAAYDTAPGEQQEQQEVGT